MLNETFSMIFKHCAFWTYSWICSCNEKKLDMMLSKQKTWKNLHFERCDAVLSTRTFWASWVLGLILFHSYFTTTKEPSLLGFHKRRERKVNPSKKEDEFQYRVCILAFLIPFRRWCFVGTDGINLGSNVRLVSFAYPNNCLRRRHQAMHSRPNYNGHNNH